MNEILSEISVTSLVNVIVFLRFNQVKSNPNNKSTTSDQVRLFLLKTNIIFLHQLYILHLLQIKTYDSIRLLSISHFISIQTMQRNDETMMKAKLSVTMARKKLLVAEQ